MEGEGKLALLKFILPKVPAMAWAGAMNSLYLSPTSTKWDLRTEIQVSVLRSIMNPGSSKPSPLGKTQAVTLTDKGARGKMWAAKVTIPKDAEGGTKEVIFKAIKEMGDGSETYIKPESESMRAEWIGFRSEAKGEEDPLPDISEEERYKKLMSEPTRKSKSTVLYFHGGAYYLCGFGTHRTAVSRLAKTCGGRGLLVEYRLAPQSAFPAQLIDALNSYLYLMYPPEGAMHGPVPANEVVFAGDSAGGNLAYALLQLLLQMQRTKGVTTGNPTVRYNGKDVEVPLPAGIATHSPWLDIARSQRSVETNAKWDYLPSANHDDTMSRFPSDDIWPTDPPRGDIFCDLSLLCHPLVSPVAAKDWSGSPPMWVSAGEELLTDEGSIVAATAAQQGVTVHWEQYEAMPHCFAMLMPHVPTSQRSYNTMGDFVQKCLAGKAETSGTWIEARTGKETSVDPKTVLPYPVADAITRIKEAQRRRINGYEKEGKNMPKPAL